MDDRLTDIPESFHRRSRRVYYYWIVFPVILLLEKFSVCTNLSKNIRNLQVKSIAAFSITVDDFRRRIRWHQIQLDSCLTEKTNFLFRNNH